MDFGLPSPLTGIISLCGVGMWSVVVALPVVQTEFAASREHHHAGVHDGHARILVPARCLTEKITDRYGIVTAIGLGIGILGLGYVVAGMSSSIWQFILMHFGDRAVLLGHLRPADGGGLALDSIAIAGSRSRFAASGITSAAQSGRRW
jgi:hypothetical protein